MQAQRGRDAFCRSDSADAVAARIEQGALYADAELTRKRRGHSSAHTALGRKADPIEPLAGVVVHAARGHDGEDGGDDRARHDLLARDGVESAVRKRGRHDREIVRRHDHRALPEVELHLGVDVVVEKTERSHEVGDRSIAVAGPAFGLVDGLVDREVSPGERRQAGDDAVELVLARAPADERRRDDGAGVDHRIRGASSGDVDADAVERIARRLAPDLREHGVVTLICERQGIHEGLGHRLDREGDLVADVVHVPVQRGERQAERRRVGRGQLRDVRRHLARGQRERVAPHLVEKGLEWPSAVAHDRPLGSRHCERRGRSVTPTGYARVTPLGCGWLTTTTIPPPQHGFTAVAALHWTSCRIFIPRAPPYCVRRCVPRDAHARDHDVDLAAGVLRRPVRRDRGDPERVGSPRTRATHLDSRAVAPTTGAE